MRGFGMPEIHWAIEQHLDQVAGLLHLDPAVVRRVNAMRAGTMAGYGAPVHDVGFVEAIDDAVAKSGRSGARGHAVDRAGRRGGCGRRLGVLPDPARIAPAGLTGLDFENGQGQHPTPFYTYGCQIAEVEVDQETGQVRVRKVTSTFAAGKVVNPALAEAQVHGGIVGPAGDDRVAAGERPGQGRPL